jgi:F-type H+-transporting ATPase subunit a
MIEAPLVIKTVFTLGPVPITEPVVVTWRLMGAMTLGSFLLTRRLKVRPGRGQAALELVVTAIEIQIRDTMGCGATTLSAADRHAPAVHPRSELVVADSRRRAPDRPCRNRRRAGADRILRCHLVRRPRPRSCRYLKTFAEPAFLMIPLNVVETFTRMFSLIMRRSVMS